MYHVEYVFGLDIADKALADMMKSMNMPFPVVKNGVEKTVTLDTPEIFTKEQTEEFKKACISTFKETKFDSIVVADARFLSINCVYRIDDAKKDGE